jgi:outer membrane immunogenic protein
MKRIVLAGLGLLAAAAVPAAAADIPRGVPYRAPAYVTTFNWTGFYLGLHGGYSWASSDGIDLRGGFVGGQVGYNWQAAGSPWVLGIELDSAWADIGRTSTVTSPFGAVSVSSDANYVGSLRVRGGYAFDRTLLYLTGGFGWIRNEITVNATVGAFTAGASDTQTHWGGLIGAGVEHAFAPNWTGRVEYLYAGYNSQTYFSSLGGVGLDASSHSLKLGVNYLFR